MQTPMELEQTLTALERAGQPPYRAIMSSTYVWRQGTWKLALHTQTPRS